MEIETKNILHIDKECKMPAVCPFGPITTCCSIQCPLAVRLERALDVWTCQLSVRYIEPKRNLWHKALYLKENTP